MAHFKLLKLWEDDDGMVQVELSASNDRQATTQDFYTYPKDVEEFGKNLSNYFPRLGKGEVTFEYGSEVDKFYSFVFVKAFYITLNSTGLLIHTNNNQLGREAAVSRFCIESNLSEINKLGLQITKWATAMQEPLSCELQKNA